jgi:hypothetical protein
VKFAWLDFGAVLFFEGRYNRNHPIDRNMKNTWKTSTALCWGGEKWFNHLKIAKSNLIPFVSYEIDKHISYITNRV